MRFSEFQGHPIGQHHRLNPRIWNGNSVRPEVRDRLLALAKEFGEFIDVPLTVLDVQIVGAQSNTTYTDHSDLDLHLVVDYNSVDCDRGVKELFDAKRLLWKQTRSVKIRGIPVEPAVEDSAKPSVSAAWSLQKNRWIRQPKLNEKHYDAESLEIIVAAWSRVIDLALKTQNTEAQKSVLTKIRQYRKQGLGQSGEFGLANLAYKTLRNRGLIELLQQSIIKSRDRELSITDKKIN